MNNKRNSKRYFRMLKHKLPYVSKMKAAYLSSIRLSIDSYLEEKPAATMEDFYNEIGTVDDLCEAYKDELTPEQLAASSRRSKLMMITVCLISALIIVICTHYIWEFYTTAPAYTETTITVE